MQKDMIEFYAEGKMVASVQSSMVPLVGSSINIRNKTWRVARVAYALDHADEWQERGMRANVDLEEKP